MCLNHAVSIIAAFHTIKSENAASLLSVHHLTDSDKFRYTEYKEYVKS